MLIVNPTATATTARSRDVVAHALAADLKLDVVATDHRGHAAELAAQAAADGLDLVVALGGDGTVNETVNGLLSNGIENAPAFAVIPGGSTNVFARNLGMTNDVVEATGELIEAITNNRFRTINLGTAKADDRAERWFTFTAGFGFDAAVVRRVERVRGKGTRATGNLYVRSAVLEYILKERRNDPSITMTVDGGAPVDGIYFSIVSSSSPWSYLGNMGVAISPEADFDKGLDHLTITTASTMRVLSTALRSLWTNGGPKGKGLFTGHDAREIHFSSTRELPLQGDGDDFGNAANLVLRNVPNSLRVPDLRD